MQTNKSISLLSACLALLAVVGVGCKKYNDNLTIAPSESHFAAAAALGGAPATGSYFVDNSPTTVFNVPIGVTTAAKVDRKVNFTISSPTGAAANTQYTVAGTTPVGTTGAVAGTITVPAGSSLASIPVRGIFAGYGNSRRDTLVITITGGDVTPSKFNNVYRLFVTQFCPVNLTALGGTYTRAFDTQVGSPTYGPYTVTVTPPVTPPTGTTGTIVLTNLFDWPSGPINVGLNWTNPAAFTATIADQFIFNYTPTAPARIRGVGTSTFSSCSQTFTLSYEVYVPGLGSFGNFVSPIAR